MALSQPFPCDDLQYPFSYLRLVNAAQSTPGVVNSGDFLVTPSSGLQVQVAPGKAYIQQTVFKSSVESASYEGLYSQLNDAPTNPFNSISAPLINPRVDLVVLRVYDTTEQGLSGSSFSRIEWVLGTETSGASVTPGASGYHSGAPSVPDNSLVLAYVLQTVGESSISSGNIENVASVCVLRSWLSPKLTSINVTAKASEWIVAQPGNTVTLPASPSVGTFVAITAASTVTGANPVTVSSGAANIYGVGLAGASSFLLGTGAASVVLEYNGGWIMLSGQRDTGWVPLTLNSGVTSPGSDAAARLIGDHGYLKGNVQNSTGSTVNNPVSLPLAIMIPSVLSQGAIAIDVLTVVGVNVCGAGTTGGSSPGNIAYALATTHQINFDMTTFRIS